MNKQELIEEFKKAGIYRLDIFGTDIEGIPTKSAICLIEQLDEPQKPAVPQFVAEWIEVAKTVYSLSGGMTYGGPGVNKWLENEDNQRTFALAWFDGYEVEKEKRYTVKVKGVIEYAECLKYGEGCRGWIFGMDNNFGNTRNAHTRKELEEAGFGWVFDCPGIELEEVTE